MRCYAWTEIFHMLSSLTCRTNKRTEKWNVIHALLRWRKRETCRMEKVRCASAYISAQGTHCILCPGDRRRMMYNGHFDPAERLHCRLDFRNFPRRPLAMQEKEQQQLTRKAPGGAVDVAGQEEAIFQRSAQELRRDTQLDDHVGLTNSNCVATTSWCAWCELL